MNEIFLSYKRSDDPGYVARLADSLQRKFGEGSVYRDVDSESAGGNWKKSITRNVLNAEIVLAVIGPEWQKIITSGSSAEQDWVRFELNQAAANDIPVIPILLSRTEFDYAKDLGDLAWLNDLQSFELADGQGRWEADIERLAGEIAKKTPLEIRESGEDKSSSIEQRSEGDQSPNIVGRDVTIKF